MAKKKKAPEQEIIPEGMSRKDYADAAFRKKVTIINLCIIAVLYLCVSTCSAYVVACSIFASWCCLTHHLGMSVTIEVVHHELGIMCTCSNVYA